MRGCPILLFYSAGPHQRENQAFPTAPAQLRLLNLNVYKLIAAQSMTVDLMGLPLSARAA
jgi:hypothetical protein